MNIRTEIKQINELVVMGDWDLPKLEDREHLFEGMISPEQACFIGGVCSRDALDDVLETGDVSASSVYSAAASFEELDGQIGFDELLNKSPSNGLRRLVVARQFWQKRRQQDGGGHMFISAERKDHDLIGFNNGREQVWKVCTSSVELNDYDVAMRVGTISVARLKFGEELLDASA